MKRQPPAPPIPAELRDALADLESRGWRAEYSPTCELWRLISPGRHWSTSAQALDKAIEAAQGIEAGAERWKAEKERQRAAIRGAR